MTIAHLLQPFRSRRPCAGVIAGTIALALLAAACGREAVQSSGATSNAADRPAQSTEPQPAAPGQPPASAAPAAPAPEDSRPVTSGPSASPSPANAAAADASARAAARDLVPGTGGAPAPRYREVTIPAGITLAVRLETALASDTSHVEDAVRGTLRRAVVINDVSALPQGTPLRGVVTTAQRSGKVKGRAVLGFRFNSVIVDDERLDVRTGTVTREARATKAKDAKTIGIPAAGGAVIGAIVGGGKGAAIGAGVGGGAGTAVVMSTRGEEVRLPEGTEVVVRLREPLTVRVRVDR